MKLTLYIAWDGRHAFMATLINSVLPGNIVGNNCITL